MKNPVESNPNSKSETERSPEAEAIISEWMHALNSTGEEQESHLFKFYHQLCTTVTPDMQSPQTDVDYLRKVVIDKGGELWIATGTCGERIFFESYRMGGPPLYEDMETPDGRVGWMHYPEPPGNIGYEHWQNFVNHFGQDHVNLRESF